MKIKPFEEKAALSTNQVHENPLLNRIYQNRNIKSSSEIEYSLTKLISPDLMMGIDEGTDILINHIMADSKILVVGDYDCDGATSTTIAVEGLRMLGAKNVDFLIPDRVKHGYGLAPKIVEIAGESKPDLIVTVDNGIAAFEGAAAVRNLEKPCQLLITDHHLTAESGLLPDADAIINPQQPGCKFPSKNIAGCGVMFYTIMALRKKMRDKDLFQAVGLTKEPRLNPLLDVLALGTIADVVQLDENNRNIVAAGLQWINAGMCRPGLRKILELKGREIGKIVSADFGFSAGPCINAAGRLDDMTIGIKCLLEKNEVLAEDLAQRLFDLNETRKELEADMVEGALDFLDTMESDRQGIIVYDGDWHEGVVGIVASRIKDRMDRPVICFTDTHELKEAKSKYERALELGVTGEKLNELKESVGEYDIKGSARSVEGIHLKHLLDEISKKNPEMLYKFGGHAMAAGLSIKSKDMDKFQNMFDDLVARDMTDEMKRGMVAVDIEDIDLDLMTIANADLVQSEAIWGQGFTQPLYSQKFEIVEKRVLKDKHLKLKVRVQGTDQEFDAIAFSCVDRGVQPVGDFMEASFKLDVNEWRGRRTLQLMIDHLQDPELAHDLEVAQQEKDKSRDIDGAVKAQKKGISLSDPTEDVHVPF